MAVFVDFDEEDIESSPDGQPRTWTGDAINDVTVVRASYGRGRGHGDGTMVVGIRGREKEKREKARETIVRENSNHIESSPEGQPRTWTGDAINDVTVGRASYGHGDGAMVVGIRGGAKEQHEKARETVVRENPNRNSTTKALGCYPIIMSVAASLDLNTLDSLSQTCRQVRENLLQYRKMLLASTVRCSNELLPISPNARQRFRERASHVLYMESNSTSNGKAGQCARDMVRECRRPGCDMVVCRNCAIKPPAPILLRHRHRRLCAACVDIPLGALTKPRLESKFTLGSHIIDHAICHCESDGVWLCQPHGRAIRTSDYEYTNIWKWRFRYIGSHGGLGTGIGDGDRGVTCTRESECCAAQLLAQETDCDAEDAREADYLIASGMTPLTTGLPWDTPGSPSSPDSAGSGFSTPPTSITTTERKSPSPRNNAGYARHEIEGIGGVVKRKRLRMVRVGACVPEWEDERAKCDILGREVQGERRSWCGWCQRVIPGKKDYEAAKQTRLVR